MDVRVLASILPMAPFILLGTVIVLSAVAKQDFPSVATIISVGMLVFLVGLLGVAGLVLASLASSYGHPRRARLAILLLKCGIVAAIAAIVIASLGIGGRNKWVLVFVIANLMCPIIVAVDSIRRLKASVPSGDTDVVV